MMDLSHLSPILEVYINPQCLSLDNLSFSIPKEKTLATFPALKVKEKLTLFFVSGSKERVIK